MFFFYNLTILYFVLYVYNTLYNTVCIKLWYNLFFILPQLYIMYYRLFIRYKIQNPFLKICKFKITYNT